MRSYLWILMLVSPVIFAQYAEKKELSDEDVFGIRTDYRPALKEPDTKKDGSERFGDELKLIGEMMSENKIRRSEGMRQISAAAKMYIQTDNRLAAIFENLADSEARFERKLITKKEIEAARELSRSRIAALIEESAVSRKMRIAAEVERAEMETQRRREAEERAELERIEAFRAQEASETRAFLGNMFRSIGNSMNRTYQQPAYQPPVRCTSSRDFSGTVSTTCY